MDMLLICFISFHAHQLIFSLYHICKLYFFSYNVFFNIFKNNQKTTISLNYIKMQNKTLLLWILQYIFIYFILIISFTKTNFLLLNNIVFLQTTLFLFFMFFFVLIFLSKNISNNLENLILIYFLVICGCFILLSNNLLQLFFLIELFGFITLYSFLTLNLFFEKQYQQNIVLILNACINQFLINFFSSFIFYLTLTFLLFYTNSSNLNNVLFIYEHNYINIYNSLIAFSILIKFGSGPWIFFKINIYKNLTINALTLYTIIYFLILFVVFFNFLNLFNIFFNNYVFNVLLILIIIFNVVQCAQLFDFNTITMFFGISSLLNIFFIILQIFLI